MTLEVDPVLLLEFQYFHYWKKVTILNFFRKVKDGTRKIVVVVNVEQLERDIVDVVNRNASMMFCRLKHDMCVEDDSGGRGDASTATCMITRANLDFAHTMPGVSPYIMGLRLSPITMVVGLAVFWEDKTLIAS
mmetsp:Transcript_2507/g.3478  ORF Transcript_2507/g.3478 Transcript_2507/m.3478 type:complete len:134 (-) Transcript_2507:301-702(-)